MDLAGRRALVTGGGGGLGEVIASTLAAREMHVLVADLDGNAAREVASRLAGTALTADLAEEHGIDALVAAAGDAPDLLVNCAGGRSPPRRHHPDASDTEWNAVLTLNLRNPMRLLQRLREPLSRSPIGAAVSISSSAGRGSEAYASPEYGVAKAGLIRLTTAVADWNERFGVRVSCVVPGWIGLPRALDEVAAMPEADRPALIPPQAIADAVLALIEDERSAGRVVVIDDV